MGTAIAMACVLFCLSIWFFFFAVGTDGFILKVLGIFISVVIASFPLAIYAGIQEEKEFNEYVVSHNCKVIGSRQKRRMVGKLMVDRTQNEWACDLGEIFWRWE